MRILLRRWASEEGERPQGNSLNPQQPCDDRSQVELVQTEQRGVWRADYSSIHSLLPHTKDLTLDTMKEFLQYCVVAQAYVDSRRRTYRPEQEKRSGNTFVAPAQDGKDSLGQREERAATDYDDRNMLLGKWMVPQLLFHHLCQTHTNVYAIYEVTDQSSSRTDAQLKKSSFASFNQSPLYISGTTAGC